MLELISVHVPKSAGMTILSCLTDYYGLDDLFLDYGGAPRPARLDRAYSSQGWFVPTARRCIHGFFNLRKYELLQPRFLVTCLREPTQRLISQYWYWMHYEGSENPLVDDVQTGKIGLVELAQQASTGELYTKTLFGEVDMHAFDLIGNFDDVDHYIDQVGALLGTSFKKQSLNENPEASYQQRVRETFADNVLMGRIRDCLRREIRFFERHAGRGLVSHAAPTPGMFARLQHFEDVIKRHPKAEEFWPPRHMNAVPRLQCQLEAEVYFYERHAEQPSTRDRLLDGSLNFDLLTGRDLVVGEEMAGDPRQQLKESDVVVDIGAGVFRSVPDIVPRIAAGNYFAIEPNKEMVAWGYENVIVAREFSGQVPPENIAYDNTFDFSWIGRPIDVAIANFVFTELPLAAFEQCLRNLASAMRSGGRFHLSDCPAPANDDARQMIMYLDGTVTFPDRMPFHHSLTDLTRLTEYCGWSVEDEIPLGTHAWTKFHRLTLRYGTARNETSPRAERKIPKLSETTLSPPIRYWWQSAEIWRHINSLLGDSRTPVQSSGFHNLITKTAGRRLGRGLSIGCGTGARELRLLLTGTVEHFDLYERSERWIESGKAEAVLFGLSDRVTWHLMDDNLATTDTGFELVYWNNTLHLQADVDRAVAWSLERLKAGGVFAMDGYVGPSRFQWSDDAMHCASTFRKSLPARFLVRPGGGSFPREVHRPSVESVMESNPAFAADSARILTVIETRLPGARIVPTGGCIYQLGFDGLIANVDEVQDAWVFSSALLLDRTLMDLGQTLYAVAVGLKSEDTTPRQLSKRSGQKHAIAGSRASRIRKDPGDLPPSRTEKEVE